MARGLRRIVTFDNWPSKTQTKPGSSVEYATSALLSKQLQLLTGYLHSGSPGYGIQNCLAFVSEYNSKVRYFH